MFDPQFSQIKQYASGIKAGKFYIDATVPQEYRHIFGKQLTRQLGNNKRQAEANRNGKIAEATRFITNKLSEFDPLVAAAEKLMEALFATCDKNGKVKI